MCRSPFTGIFTTWRGCICGMGTYRFTTLDGKVTQGFYFEPPFPYFQLRGRTHKEEAVGGPNDPEQLAIMVDLKEPEASGGVTSSQMQPAFPREGAKDVLDNARVRMWDYTWVPEKPVAMHIHDLDSVEIIVTGGTRRMKTPDGKEELRTVAMKEARFVPRGRVDSEEAVDSSPRAITIELK